MQNAGERQATQTEAGSINTWCALKHIKYALTEESPGSGGLRLEAAPGLFRGVVVVYDVKETAVIQGPENAARG